MADVTKEKILKINTTGAEKNVKSLKTQIRELKEQLAQLEKGTEEYNAVARQLANANQKQIEINEAMKYSNKDLGATLSNLTKVSAGVVGAISSINSVMVLMGADSEEAMEAMKSIQAMMAIIQGLSAIDTATKALEGLTNAFKGLNDVRVKTITTSVGASGAELAEAGALADNTVKMHKNNEEAKEFNRLNKEGEEATKKSTEAIDKETTAIFARTEAQKGNIEAAKKYKEELERLNQVQRLDESNAQNLGYTKAIEEYERRIKGLEANLMYHSNQMTDEMIQETKRKLQYYQTALGTMIMSSTTATDDIVVAVEGSLNSIINNSHSSFEDMEEDILTFNTLLKGLPFDVAQEKAQQANDFFERCIASFKMGVMMGEQDAEEALKDFQNLQYILAKETNTTLSAIKEREIAQAELQKKILETTEAENAETNATNANTLAKKVNAKATEDVADAEKKLGTETKKNDPILRKAWSGLTTGIKNAVKALLSFIKTNPILTSIAVVIGAITYALVKYTNAVKEANKETKLRADISADVKHAYKEETVRLNTLLKTVNNVYETQAERKKAYEELNKIIPEYNAHLDETTGKYVANDKALEDYLAHLREKAYLEAYEGKIKEYMQEQLELQLKINKIQNSGWNLFGWRINKAQKKIDELGMDIEEMYRKILNLDLSKALDENKPTQSPVKTVLKTFKDIIDSIKSMYADIWNTIFNEKELKLTYNGIYRETDILFNNIERLIKSRNIQGLLSDEFKKAMSEGFTDDMSFNITLDWVFDRTQQEKFYNELEKERINLEKMLSDKTKKYTDEEIKAQQDTVNGLKAEEESRKLVLEAVQKYFVQRRKEADETERLANAQENYNHQLKVEKKYIEEQRRGDRDAEANKEIALGEYQIEIIKQRIQYRQSEIDMLKSLPLQNEQVLSRIKELNAEQLEDQKKTNEELEKVDNAYYQKRLLEIEQKMEAEKKAAEQLNRDNEKRENDWGISGGTYNTDLDFLKVQKQMLENQKKAVEKYYKEQIELAAGNKDEQERLEMEKNAAILELDRQLAEQREQIAQESSRRRLKIAQTYVSAYQSISSQIGSIISAEMDRYDENSKEYLRLKYAQGVTDTLSGTLAAYMSGIESGLVPPANTILAGVLAAMTFATGVAQLANIKKGSLSNAATASTVQIGNEYDTLSYAQNAEILSNIQDSRVWVLESDISSTQQRVRVQETQSTF